MKINGNPDGGGGGSAVIEGLSITSNGTYTAGAGVDGYSPVEVDVQPELQNKTVVENGEYIADQGYYGLGTVTVSVPSPQFVTESLSVSVNGTYTPGQGVDGYSQVVVDVPQSVTGFTEKDITEGVQIVNLSNSASSVHPNVFEKDNYLQTVNLPNCTEVGTEAFASCNNLTTVNLPVCTSINNSAFYSCNSLTSINMPLITYISNSAFYGCNLTSIDLPKCISLSLGAFQSCTSLSQVSLPVCEYIGNQVFSSCRSLNSLTLCTDVYWTIPYQSRMLSNTPIMSGTGSIYVRSDTYNLWITSTGWSSLSDRFVSVETSGIMLSFSDGLVYGVTDILKSEFTKYIGVSKTDVVNLSLENCKTIYNETLFDYGNLTTISLPECKIISTAAFQECHKLSILSLPKCEMIGSYAFMGTMQSMQDYVSINLPVCSYIGLQAFSYAHKLNSITLGSTSVCTLENTNAFHSTNISSGSIFVPGSLVDAYKSAPNWSQYSSRIFPIE